jgi:hypothetical protein
MSIRFCGLQISFAMYFVFIPGTWHVVGVLRRIALPVQTQGLFSLGSLRLHSLVAKDKALDWRYLPLRKHLLAVPDPRV